MSFLSSRTHSAGQGFGQPVLRKEDRRLVTGAGCYSDDVNLPGQAYACLVRSPHAHARIRHVDSAGARAIPGVIAVLTGHDAPMTDFSRFRTGRSRRILTRSRCGAVTARRSSSPRIPPCLPTRRASPAKSWSW